MLELNKRVVLTLPGGEAPEIHEGTVVTIYMPGFNGEANRKPTLAPADAKGNVSYNVDIKLDDGTVYRFVSHAPTPKCWHWCWINT